MTGFAEHGIKPSAIFPEKNWLSDQVTVFRTLKQSHLRAQFQICSGQPAAEAAATTPRKARTAELRTLTSRNPGKPGYREKASRVDGSECADYCDKDGSPLERSIRKQIRTSGRPW